MGEKREGREGRRTDASPISHLRWNPALSWTLQWNAGTADPEGLLVADAVAAGKVLYSSSTCLGSQPGSSGFGTLTLAVAHIFSTASRSGMASGTSNFSRSAVTLATNVPGRGAVGCADSLIAAPL